MFATDLKKQKCMCVHVWQEVYNCHKYAILLQVCTYAWQLLIKKAEFFCYSEMNADWHQAFAIAK